MGLDSPEITGSKDKIKIIGPDGKDLNHESVSDILKYQDILEKVFKIVGAGGIEKLKTIDEIQVAINDIRLAQKLSQNELGIPGRDHESQTLNVLRNSAYWDLQNHLHLLEIKKRIIENKIENFASFSVGGSIGAGYLGSLYKAEKDGIFPDVIFGASAGALFPAIYLLWQKARKINPEKTSDGLEGIFRFLPEKLEGKTMWSDGEELIYHFKTSAQSLIDTINEKLPSDRKLPNIDKISIEDISPTIAVIASRKILDKTKSKDPFTGGTVEPPEFQEVIFSGKDKLLNSIIASSNPEISMLGMNISVLTDKQNKFYGNTWHDGDYTDSNPFDYGKALGLKNRRQYVSFQFLLKNSQNEKNPNEDAFKTIINKDRDFYEYVDVVPDVEGFLKEYPGDMKTNSYKVLDQNDGWGSDDMKLKIILSYYQKLTFSNFGNFVRDIDKNIVDPKIKMKIFESMKTKGLNIGFGNLKEIGSNIKALNESSLTKEEVKVIIKNIFYYDFTFSDNKGRNNYMLKYPFLESSLLPLKIDEKFQKIIEDQTKNSEQKGDYLQKNGLNNTSALIVLNSCRGHSREILKYIDNNKFKEYLLKILNGKAPEELKDISIYNMFGTLYLNSDLFDGIDRLTLLRAFTNGYLRDANKIDFGGSFYFGIAGNRQGFFSELINNTETYKQAIDAVDKILGHLEQLLNDGPNSDLKYNYLRLIQWQSIINEEINIFKNIKKNIK